MLEFQHKAAQRTRGTFNYKLPTSSTDYSNFRISPSGFLHRAHACAQSDSSTQSMRRCEWDCSNAAKSKAMQHDLNLSTANDVMQFYRVLLEIWSANYYRTISLQHSMMRQLNHVRIFCLREHDLPCTQDCLL